MMTSRTAAITVAILVCGALCASAADVRRVSAVEFRGLVNLSKYDIMRGAKYRPTDDGVVIDVDSLRVALEGNYYLESYRIDERGGRLIVTVSEKRPELIVVVAGARRSAVYELDASFAILSRDAVHAGRAPVLHLTAEDIGAEKTEGRIGRLFSLLRAVRKRFPAVYRELSDLSLREDGVRVVLRGRRTVFSLGFGADDFARLHYLVGHFDRAGRYPDEIHIAGNAVIAR